MLARRQEVGRRDGEGKSFDLCLFLFMEIPKRRAKVCQKIYVFDARGLSIKISMD